MRAYLDAMVWIYALEDHPTFGAAAQQLLLSLRAGRHTILSSHFLLAEVLVLPTRQRDAFTIAAYKRTLLVSDSVSVIPFHADAAGRFAELRATQRVKSPDAIHLALAASARADAFLTTDIRLLQLTIPGISRIGDLTFRFA